MEHIAKHCFQIFGKSQNDWQKLLKVLLDDQTLKLLGEVLLNGNPELFNYLQDNRSKLMVLEHYNYYDKGIDRGILIREKLSWMNRVLDSREQFLEEKSKSGQLFNSLNSNEHKGISGSGKLSPGLPPKEEGIIVNATNNMKKKISNLKIKLTGSDQKEDNTIDENLIDDEIERENVHFNSVPVNKKYDFAFFQEETGSKASNNDALSTFIFTQLLLLRIVSELSWQTYSRER